MTKIEKDSLDGSLQTRGAFFKRAQLDIVQNQIANAARRYVDPATGAVDATKVTTRTCLVCGSREMKLLFTKNGFPHVRCLECGFIFVNPILREDVLAAYYSAIEGSWAEITEQEEYDSIQSRYYHFHMDNIEDVLTSANRTLLDIGCSSGRFLNVARARLDACGSRNQPLRR